MKARLPQGYGGGGGNMQSMLRQAQKMQEDAAALQADLETREYTANAGGGMVSATVNWKYEITALSINPDVIDADEPEMLEDLVRAAVNAALRDAKTNSEEEMGKITAGLNLPGMF